MPPQFLSTDVQSLLQVCHLASQSFNKRSIPLDLILTSSLPSSSSRTRTVKSDLSETREPRAMRFLTAASVVMPGSRADSPRKTGAIVLRFALVYYWCKGPETLRRGLRPVRRFGLSRPNREPTSGLEPLTQSHYE